MIHFRLTGIPALLFLIVWSAIGAWLVMSAAQTPPSMEKGYAFGSGVWIMSAFAFATSFLKARPTAEGNAEAQPKDGAQ